MWPREGTVNGQEVQSLVSIQGGFFLPYLILYTSLMTFERFEQNTGIAKLFFSSEIWNVLFLHVFSKVKNPFFSVKCSQSKHYSYSLF